MVALLRRRIIYMIELASLFGRHKKSYIDYFLNKRTGLYTYLEHHGCSNIKAVQLLEWKIWYGSYYFKAMFNGERVFIKVTAGCTNDGYLNELICNNYIKNNSPFLAERTPKVLLNFVEEDYHVIVFEYFDICQEIKQDDLKNAVCEFCKEYSRIGVIHQDIKPSNLTMHNGKYCMIDYGYAICPDSNNMRIKRENYIEDISDTGRDTLDNADFYYDDVVASGIKNARRDEVNFIVGRKNEYFIRLAGVVYEYRLEQ